MKYNIFYRSIFRLFLIYVLGLIIFQLFRVALLINFSSYAELQNYKLDLATAFFYIGLKFDSVVILYILFIPFICSVVGIFIPERFNLFHRVSLKLTFWFSFILFVLTTILLTGNYYFYKFFQSNINLLVFGLLDDDTKSVAYSMWTDYPVIIIIIGWIAAAILLYITIRRLISVNIKFEVSKNYWFHTTAIVFISILFILGMRGSLGIFPIGKDDATISPNTFINSITMNGVFSLKDAISDYKDYSISTDSTVTLSKYGYTSKQEVLDDIKDANERIPDFTDTTKESDFISKNPPHVVFCLMESMSNYYLDINSPSLNLMGELENQIKSCIVFRNFTSGCNGTIHTLEGLMVNTPLTPLSQSSFMEVALPSSVAKTFIENGYETNFVTGAKLGWRNLGKYASIQHFQNVEGCASILEKVPNTQMCEWGAHDEFVFQRVFDILKNAKKPQFIFILSITNHTPYKLPESYKPYPVTISDSIRKALHCNVEIALKNFTAYQYASNSIGVFIKNLKSVGLSNNTIIAATGDHNTMALFDYDDANMLMKYSVPLIMYIPNTYKPKTIDVSRFGSHKDIFPTLFNLSLSKAKYYKSGNDLFGIGTEHYFALNDYKKAFDRNGCVFITKKPISFEWNNKRLKPGNLKKNPELKKLLTLAKGYAALLELDIQQQLLASKKRKICSN